MKVGNPRGCPVEFTTEEYNKVQEVKALIKIMQINLCDLDLTEYYSPERPAPFDSDDLQDLYETLSALIEINVAY